MLQNINNKLLKNLNTIYDHLDNRNFRIRKTTIAHEIIRKYKKYLPNLINIDGDIVRHFFEEQSPRYEENTE